MRRLVVILLILFGPMVIGQSCNRFAEGIGYTVLAIISKGG